MAWYMKCPKCGQSVNRSKGQPYQEDAKHYGTWRTVTKQKVNYDCSNPDCDYTKTETKVFS